MANGFRYAKEWTPWVASDEATAIDVDDTDYYEPGAPIWMPGASTNRPSGIARGVIQTFEHTDDSIGGVYQIAMEHNSYQIRKRAGSVGSYSWGAWLTSGASWSWAKVDSVDDVPEGEARVVEIRHFADDDPEIPKSYERPTGFAGRDYALVSNVAASKSFEARAMKSGSTGNAILSKLFYQEAAPASSLAFSFRDITAIGFADVSDEKWLAAETNVIDRVHYISGGVSLSKRGEPVDGFSYGQVLESRILRDSIPELQIQCYMTDAAKQPPDNERSGKTKMIEIGLKNASGQTMLLQCWNGRLISLTESLPEAQFAFREYNYRLTDFRFEVPSAAQIIDPVL